MLLSLSLTRIPVLPQGVWRVRAVMGAVAVAGTVPPLSDGQEAVLGFVPSWLGAVLAARNRDGTFCSAPFLGRKGVTMAVSQAGVKPLSLRKPVSLKAELTPLKSVSALQSSEGGHPGLSRCW